MSDKLSESIWTSFTKKQQLQLEDGPLIKALAKFDKIDEAKHEARLDALKDVAEQVKKQIVALARRKKELGDKPFNLAKAKLDEFLELAEDLQKKTRDAADQDTDDAEEADTPALLTTKMVPLLRQLRKGEPEALQMHALIGTAGKGTAVLIMRRAITPARRKLLAEALNATGGGKYIPAQCLFENKVLTFVVKAPAGGLAKRLRLALLEQTEMRLKVKVRGDDGEDEEPDVEDGGEDQAGVQAPQPQVPPVPGQERVDAPTPSAEQLRYEALLRKIQDPLAQALRDQHPDMGKLRALMAFAGEKGDDKNYAAALQALEKLALLLASAPPKVEPSTPVQPVEPGAATGAAKVRAPAGPVAAGPYWKMKGRVLPQLDMARTRNAMLGEKIRRGVADADALSIGGDDAAAIASLRALVQEVEDVLEQDRQEIQTRMEALYEQATRIRLALKPDADTVRFSVRGLVKAWDLGTAKVMLDTFEKAIEKAKPLDFENLDVVQDRRAQQFRAENAKFARNAEQALLAAKRIIDGDGNLVLDSGALKGLPMVRTDDLAAVAAEIAASGNLDLPQTVHALQILQRLQTDKASQEALKTVKAPPDPSTAATEEGKQSLRAAQALIRNTLGLADDAKIGDVEAKQAAVAALLAQVRQVDVGSCFATASAVRVQRNKPEQFLADIADMLSTGKLTRSIEHPAGSGTMVTIDVPIARDMVGRKVDVTRKDTNLHLKPNMIAALDAMGIANSDQKKAIEEAAARLRAERALAKALGKVASHLPAPHTVETVKKAALEALDGNPSMTIEAALRSPLSKIVLSTEANAQKQRKESNTRKDLAFNCTKDFDDADGADDFTPQELLAQIGKTRPDGALKPEQVAAAKAAFDTSHDNTLTRAWEYTIATMMEKHPRGSDNGKTLAAGIGEAVEAALEALASRSGLTTDEADEESAIGSWVADEVADKLDEGFEARYDPGVGSRSGATAADGASSGGGYSLFYKGGKIDGQAEFEAAVAEMMEASKAFFDTNTNGWSAAQVNRAKAMIDEMKKKAETQAFRDSVIDAHAKGKVTVASGDPSYAKKLADAKDGFAKPWTTTGGGGDTTIMQLYENRKQPVTTESSSTFTYKVGNVDTAVTDGEGLTHFLLATFAKMGVGGRLPDGDAAERASVPVGNPIHAFTLKPGSTSMASALKLGKDPAEFIADFKGVEGVKNAKRRAVPVPLGDLSAGFAADGIAQAVSIFPQADRAAATAAIKGHFTTLGAQSLSLDQFKAQLKQAVRQVLDTSYAYVPADKRDGHATMATGRAVTAAKLLDRVVPKEEYAPLIDAAMRKLSVPDASRDTIKKEVLKAVTQDAVVREDFAKAVRIEMRKLGLGEGRDDLKLTRDAYDKLTTDEERIAALKAAGKTVASPAARYDALKEEDAKALREQGVCARLDAKLDTSLVEPRGLVFADPNWGSGDHMTVFTMVVDPLSDPPTMEMWQMNEDGSAPVKMNQKEWIADGPWHVFADPEEYGGAMASHEVSTTTGAKPWEVFRAELRAKLDDFVVAGKPDLGKLQGILDIADARFADSDFAAADKAINKLAAELAEPQPQARLTGALAKGIRVLDGVAAAVNKEIEARRQTAKDNKLKMPTPEMTAAFAAAAVLGGLTRTLRSGIKTPEDLSKFVAERRDVLDYIDTQSPTGATNLVTTLTA